MNLTDCHAKHCASELTRRRPSHRLGRIATAWLLGQDGEVIKWLRPARNQFHIYYDHNAKRYEPDFVAETAAAIYMVETKKAGDLDTDAVQKKKTAALNYCAAASAYTAATGGKPWIYLLIPHDAVMLNMTLEGLAAKYGVRM